MTIKNILFSFLFLGVTSFMYCERSEVKAAFEGPIGSTTNSHKLRNLSEKTHAYLESQATNPNAADDYTTSIITPSGIVFHAGPIKTTEKDYLNAGKSLPDTTSKNIVGFCALIEQDRRLNNRNFTKNQTYFAGICPCDFYENLTDKQSKQVKNGALHGNREFEKNVREMIKEVSQEINA